MRNGERSVGARLGRALILIAGVVGALAAFDAVLLFLVLLTAAVFGDALNPYIGLLLFVALPIAVIAGGAMAWTAYTISSEAGGPRAGNSPHVRT